MAMLFPACASRVQCPRLAVCCMWGGGLFILLPLSCHSWQEETWKAQGANQFLGSDPYFELAVIMKYRTSHVWLYPWNCSTPTVAPDLTLCGWEVSRDSMFERNDAVEMNEIQMIMEVKRLRGLEIFFFVLVGWGVLGFFCVGYVYFFSCARCIGGSREDKCTAWLPALWKLFLALWQNRPDDLLSILIHEKLLHLLTSDAFIVNNGLFCTAKAGKGKPIAIPNEFHCCNSKIAHFETL